MIIQGCLNGARRHDFHVALPVTIEQIAADGARCVARGAAELHVHPRGKDGRESLSTVDDTMRALWRTCPGTLIGVSTGSWIENDVMRTRERIAAWNTLPDYASVNLSEQDAPAVMDLLDRMGVGIEAGLATVADAERFITLPQRRKVLRVLIEIEEQNVRRGDGIVSAICEILNRENVCLPILLHGFDATVWHFVRQARKRNWSTRIGLEDGCSRTDGSVAVDNADLIGQAVQLFREVASS